MSTSVTRGRQVYLYNVCLFSSCSLLFPKMTGKSADFSRTHILRDAPRFSGEHAHWVDYKEKLDDVLFAHSSSLRDILQGRARPEKYVLVPNEVAVIPTYVLRRAPTTDGKAHSRAMERERRKRGPVERKSGCRTSSSKHCRANNACCTDCRFCDRTYGPYFANFLGVPRKISSHSGKFGRNKILVEPCMRIVGSRKRRTISHLTSHVQECCTQFAATTSSGRWQ